MGKRTATGLTLTLLLLLGIAIFFYSNFNTVVVAGNSMEPAYLDGDKLWASRAYWLVGSLKKNDVIVIKIGKTPRDYIIKRIYGLEGDVIDWNNVPEGYSMTNGEYKVPEDHVYVLGDNRDVSEDSRVNGPYMLSQVLGKVLRKR